MSAHPTDADKTLLEKVRALESAGRALEAIELLKEELRATKILVSRCGQSRIEVPDHDRALAAARVFFFIERGEWPSVDSHLLMFQVDGGRWLRLAVCIRRDGHYLTHWIDDTTDAEAAALAKQIEEAIADILSQRGSDGDSYRHPRTGGQSP